MNLTDKIYVIDADLDIFGEIIPTEETMLDCRIMSKQRVEGNVNASSIEDKYELKVYIPHRKVEPYKSFKEKRHKLFRYEDIIYELVMKITAKNFFGDIHHYELTIREIKDVK